MKSAEEWAWDWGSEGVFSSNPQVFIDYIREIQEDAAKNTKERLLALAPCSCSCPDSFFGGPDLEAPIEKCWKCIEEES